MSAVTRRPHSRADVPVTENGPAFVCEDTAVGRQTLTPGVAPITLHDQLTVRLAAPASPRRYAGPQKPCDIGLFDTVARSQTDLVDLAREAARRDPFSQSPKAKE